MYHFNVRIAGVTFCVNANHRETEAYFSSFLTGDPADEVISITGEDIEHFMRDMPGFTREMSERAVLKYRMDKTLVGYGAFPFHASALAYKGEGYVFTALSGVGKSTHTRIWKQTYPDDVVIVNDDRPYLKVTENAVFAYSHPQAGKHMLYTNTCCPVKVIGRIVRSERNYVRRIAKAEYFPFFVQQTFTMDDPRVTSRIIALIMRAMDLVALYEIHCNMDSDAARTIREQLQLDMFPDTRAGNTL